jgi:Ca2+-binding RTX toxin-like protein
MWKKSCTRGFVEEIQTYCVSWSAMNRGIPLHRGLAALVVPAALLAAMMLAPAAANAGVLSSSGGIITYVANQGERNDVLVSSDFVFAPVYTFKDLDSNPITAQTPCQLINGVGMCPQAGITSFIIDARDGDDTAQVAEVGAGGAPPLTLGAQMIGGRGVDVLFGGNGGDILKGNDGRDSLRGRGGVDVYKGGRGVDNLQTLDGIADGFISCGDGNRDVVRKDRIDPKAHHCEFSNRGNPSKPH